MLRVFIMEEPGGYKPKNANYGVCAFWCLFLLLLTIGGLVFAIVYINTIGKGTDAEEIMNTAPPPTTVCETPECVSLAASLLQTIDTSINPCHDFYEYACGTWIKSTVIPEGHQVIGNMYSRGKDKQRDLRVLLEAPETSNEPEAIMKAKALYNSCVDKETRESIGITDINQGVEDVFGGWPVLEDNLGGKFDASQFDLTNLLAGLFIDAGSTSLLRVAAIKMDGNENDHVLQISAGAFTGLPSAEYLTDAKYKKEQDAYLKYMTEVAILLGARSSVATPEMMAVFDLEQQLAEAKLNSEETPDNFVTVSEMQTLYPEVNWSDFLKQLVPETVTAITDDFVVLNSDANYLRSALDILKSVPERLVADWMLWLCYEDATPYLNDAIRNAYTEFHQAVRGMPANDYYQDCVEVAARHLHSATTRLFIDQYLSPETEDLVEDLSESILTAQINLIEASTLEEQAKDWAISMLTYVTIKVGIPDYILDNSLLDQEYAELETPSEKIFNNFLSVLSFRVKQNIALLSDGGFEKEYLSRPEFNDTVEIGVPPEIAVMFNEDLPWFINLGHLGMILGHPLAAKLIELLPETTNQCVEDQYGMFWFPENGKPLAADPRSLVGDNAGLQVATKAFLDELWTRDLQTLPGLPLTVQQLFFLNNAQALCDKYTTEYADTFDSAWPPRPVPGRFRVNGMMQNSETFARAFECPADSRMNPSNKCTIY